MHGKRAVGNVIPSLWCNRWPRHRRYRQQLRPRNRSCCPREKQPRRWRCQNARSGSSRFRAGQSAWCGSVEQSDMRTKTSMNGSDERSGRQRRPEPSSPVRQPRVARSPRTSPPRLGRHQQSALRVTDRRTSRCDRRHAHARHQRAVLDTICPIAKREVCGTAMGISSLPPGAPETPSLLQSVQLLRHLYHLLDLFEKVEVGGVGTGMSEEEFGGFLAED